MRSNTPERAAAELAEREAALLAGGATVAAAQFDEPPALDLSNLMERPEVKAAIAAAASAAAGAAVAAMLAKLADERGEPAAQIPNPSGDRAFVESLALSINELIDQGRPGAKRTVAPAVLAMRLRARERMVELLLNARARGIVPEYHLTAAVYLSETWIKPTWVANDHVERSRRVKWPGVPNQAMRPENEMAREVYRLFCESIGASVTPAAKDPLVAGFEVIGKDGNRPETGAGQGAGSHGAIELGELYPVDALQKPIHILGTIADPARPTTYNG
jgi:hypothetical protein